MKFIQTLSPKIKGWSQKSYRKSTILVQKRPLLSLIVILVVLFGLIALSNTLLKPKVEVTEKAQTIKDVNVYKVGANPTIQTQAVIEKSGVIKIVALGGGVIQKINVSEGDEVKKGTNLAWLSTNYQGGNMASAQRNLAQAQYKNVLKTFNTQKEIIQKQRDIANKTDENSDQMRDISSKSSNDTNNLINLNQSMINQLNNDLKDLEQNNVGGVNDAAILEVKGAISQLEGGNLQLRNTQRNNDYANAGDKPQAQLSDLQREIALKQLDVQDKALDLQKEVSRLQVVIAGIQEAVYHPVAPFSGRVDRIYVRVGQAINPGTPIMEIAGNSQDIQAVVLTSQDIARKVSFLSPSVLHIGEVKIEVLPIHTSSEATDGNMHSVIFSIPEDYKDIISDKSYVTIDLLINNTDINNLNLQIPVDAIYQSQSENSLLVAKNGKVETRKVSLGAVTGNFVEITAGLESGDQIILNRNVIAGDKVKVIN